MQSRKNHRKYYLNYPKSPVLDIKWENCDIIVLEQENIPKFSNLDDIVTPVKLLELFFNDVLVEMIVGYTKLYSHREKAGISFQITNKKKFLLLMFMLIGCHKPSIAITTEFCPLHRQLCLLQTSCLIDCE